MNRAGLEEPGEPVFRQGGVDSRASRARRAARGAGTGTGKGTNRKVQTQEKILRAAMDLFALRGYDRTSIRQIATRAGVSRASIFWHFSDKATLFDETCRHFLIPFRESLERSADHSDPRQRILQQIDAYERFVEEQRRTIHSFVSWVFASQPRAESLRDELMILHRAFQRRLGADLTEILGNQTEAEDLAAVLTSLLHGNMLLNLGAAPPETRISRSELLRRLLARILPPG